MLEALHHHLKLPDPWQHEAVSRSREGHDVIVCAPTGAGKTYIFELLVQTSTSRAQKVYTVPTRALANDKYAEWKDAGWKVGLATGDLSENVDAPVLVATLETQLERLLQNRGPELLVIDEFQMIADGARGAHYEGAIALCPANTRLLLLSGSVENPDDVATWMRRLGRTVTVVSTKERPVPLEEIPLEVLPQKMRGLEGYWPKLAASALVADLAPLLIFAPRRREAESIATKLASALPQGEPLSLTSEQRALAGKDFTALLERRIAYHHSGLSYAVRAGLVEPLAKAGQLRVVVSTMGLAAGINFSVRSVHVSGTTYHDGIFEQELQPDELLQMYGRAGRRGLDERGYVLTTRNTPTLSDARAARLRRATKLSWPLFMRVMRRAAEEQRDPYAAAREFAARLYAKSPPELGLESSSSAEANTGGTALFGLKGVHHELLNSAGQWEPRPPSSATGAKAPQASGVLGEAWIATTAYQGPALASIAHVQTLAAEFGRICKLSVRDGRAVYGKEIALGQIIPDSPDIAPTQHLRKWLRIPRNVERLTPQVLDRKCLPRLAEAFAGGKLTHLADKGGLRWAQYDFSDKPVHGQRDSLGKLLIETEERTRERESAHDIKILDQEQGARPGSPVHAWRTLGLIEAHGAPTPRGVLFSYFQHGEGLAIAAALEDVTYPIEELLCHIANLRSDCHFDLPDAGGSARLAAVCRNVYGFVNHHGYLEAGLPIGYGEGTAELLGLVPGVLLSQRHMPEEVAEGDLTRAYIEWLSLLRHITHAPAPGGPRWGELQRQSAETLEAHLAKSGAQLHPRLPKLTPKQKHERPHHWLR